ncbi:MAG: sigma-70 family RNA polymerase sigma factor [Pseudomonadota bacterium]
MPVKSKSDHGAERILSRAEAGAPRANDDTRKRELVALYQQRAPKLTATLRKMFGNGPPDPEDVVQQAFQKILERGDCSDIEDLNAFLWRTARNICLKGRRHEDVRAKFDFEIEHLFFPQRGDDSSPEGVLSTKEELHAINEALRAMPDTRRRAFVLNKVEGLTVTDVAKRLRIGRSPATRHISRAMRDIELHLMRKRGGEG